MSIQLAEEKHKVIMLSDERDRVMRAWASVKSNLEHHEERVNGMIEDSEGRVQQLQTCEQDILKVCSISYLYLFPYVCIY